MAYSGLTNVSALAWKAASVIQLNLNAGNVELGRVYTKDVIFDPQILVNTTEALAMVDGSKTFNGGHGGLEITGNASAGATRFSGVICTEN